MHPLLTRRGGWVRSYCQAKLLRGPICREFPPSVRYVLAYPFTFSCGRSGRRGNAALFENHRIINDLVAETDSTPLKRTDKLGATRSGPPVPAARRGKVSGHQGREKTHPFRVTVTTATMGVKGRARWRGWSPAGVETRGGLPRLVSPAPTEVAECVRRTTAERARVWPLKSFELGACTLGRLSRMSLAFVIDLQVWPSATERRRRS